MKKIFIFISLVVIMIMASCSDSSKIGTIDEAEKKFIDWAQYMTKEEALSKEINYYKDPQITIRRKVRELSGKDAIHECNLYLEENKEALIRFDVDDEKEYAIQHPDEIVGAEYYFEGIFTHWNNGYDTRKAKVLFIKGSYIVVIIY